MRKTTRVARTAEENGGNVRIRVDRSGDTAGAAAVGIRTVSETATASLDFQASQQTLSFAPGQVTRVFEAAVIDDRWSEGNETFRAELFDPSAGTQIGTPSFVTITINANDALGLVSVNQNGTASGNNESTGTIKISDDGRYVAFESNATDLTTGDTNGDRDLFVRDRLTGATTLVTRNSSGTGSANESSSLLDMSPNGHFILFSSVATDLVAGVSDQPSTNDLFVYDMLLQTMTLVSVATSGAATGNDNSAFGTISDDGRFVAFYSTATDLVNGVTDDNRDQFDERSGEDVFLRDLVLGTTTLVTRSVLGNATGNSRSDYTPQVSSDGSSILFVSRASDLVAGVNDANAKRDVFVWDRQTETTRLVSVNSSGNAAGNKESSTFSSSRDGRYVAYTSEATDLVTGISDLNSGTDVFVRDLGTNTTTLVSRSESTNSTGNGTVVFQPKWHTASSSRPSPLGVVKTEPRRK